MGRAAVAPADRVPVPCSITVPLKRLKHFDCKDKQALLVGGFGRLCERLVRGQGPLRSPGHRGRVGRGVPASTSGCLRPAAPRRGRQGRVPGGGSSRSSRRPFPGCPEGRRGPGPRDGGRCPPWPHAARARAPRAAACSSVLSTASPMGRDLSERRARPEAVPLVPAPKRWAWGRHPPLRGVPGARRPHAPAPPEPWPRSAWRALSGPRLALPGLSRVPVSSVPSVQLSSRSA